MKDRLYNLMCEADIESGCVYGDCDLKFIADHLIDSGLVIALPCKVGDTVWAIFPTWTPMECEVVAIEILSSTVNIETKVVDSDADRIFWPADFGKTVFLTKEEAELKLAELKGE